jgi:hypothetical protein
MAALQQGCDGFISSAGLNEMQTFLRENFGCRHGRLSIYFCT